MGTSAEGGIHRTLTSKVILVYYVPVRTKPEIPEPQGKTPMERMDWAFRTVLKATKEAPQEKERAKHPRREKPKDA